MKEIGVIDYGMGNLRSVSKALEHLGSKVYVGSQLRRLSRVHKLVLPGVGAFGDAMRELEKRGLVDIILKFVERRKPLLGICLGLQLFFERSQESPRVRGLGIWKGSVVAFKPSGWRQKNLEVSARKIPHMGWNQVTIKRRSQIMSQVKNNEHFYFVHSYYAQPEDKALTVGATNYGIEFPTVLESRSVFALQFHPEKSQRAGLQILKNFIKL